MTILKIFKPEDSEEANAISTFCEGEHFVGRDKLSDCHDRRVSRKHALIHVRADGVTLTAVHVNPCYFKLSNENLIQIVRKDCTINLENGDQFSLLMDLFWYKVKVISSTDSTSEHGMLPINRTKDLKRGLDDGKNSDTCKRLKTSDINNQTVSVTPEMVPNIDTDSLVNNLNAIINEDYGKAGPSTTLLQKEDEGNKNLQPNFEVNVKNLHNNNDPGHSSSVDNIQSKERTDGSSEELSEVSNEIPSHSISSNELLNENNTNIQQEIPLDRSTPCDTVLDRIKQEVVENESDPAMENAAGSSDTGESVINFVMTADDIKKEPDEDDDNSGNADPNGPSGSSNNSTRRDRCWYGQSCYRKNPTHRSNLSHPGDEDYDSDPNDDRPECPFGPNCYRVNMEHRRRYKHHGRPSPKPANVNILINVNRNCPFCSHCSNNYRKPGYESDNESDSGNEL